MQSDVQIGEAYMMSKDVGGQFPFPTPQLDTIGYEVHTTSDSGSSSSLIVGEADNTEGEILIKESSEVQKDNDVAEEGFVIQLLVRGDVSTMNVEREGHHFKQCVADGCSADNDVHVAQPYIPPIVLVMQEATKRTLTAGHA